MIISQGNNSPMTRQLKEAEKNGFRYVVMEKDSATDQAIAGTLQFFRDKGEAYYAGYLANSVHGRNVEVLPVKEVLKDMERQTDLFRIRMNDPNAFTNLVIDTGRIRHNEIARQEIFTDEIGRKLKDQNIQPDVKQLREHIAADKQQFSVNGVGKENGKEKGYRIHIEQNPERAFIISQVVPQKEIERSISINILRQEELLGGRMHKEDAAGIKQAMQAQQEAGNRFVAFENGQQRITGRQFIGFENAMQAVEFVHQKAKENQIYLFRAVSVIEKEADRVLGNKQELSKDTGKKTELEHGEKKMRGSELSR